MPFFKRRTSLQPVQSTTYIGLIMHSDLNFVAWSPVCRLASLPMACPLEMTFSSRRTGSETQADHRQQLSASGLTGRGRPLRCRVLSTWRSDLTGASPKAPSCTGVSAKKWRLYRTDGNRTIHFRASATGSSAIDHSRRSAVCTERCSKSCVASDGARRTAVDWPRSFIGLGERLPRWSRWVSTRGAVGRSARRGRRVRVSDPAASCRPRRDAALRGSTTPKRKSPSSPASPPPWTNHDLS